MKLQIIATQADGGDTNAALLFDEIVAKAETRPSSPPPATLSALAAGLPTIRPATTRTTASMLRAARAAGPRLPSHSLGRRRSV